MVSIGVCKTFGSGSILLPLFGNCLVGMMKLVDMSVLEAVDESRVGSNPTTYISFRSSSSVG